MILGFSHAGYPKETDRLPTCQEFLGTLYMRAHGMRNSNQILHDDQIILEENFTGSTTPPVVAKQFLTGM